MKQSEIRGIAILMMALIVIIPVYSADAMARIVSARVYGVDNISGYARKQDNVVINATVTIPDDTNITASQMKVGDKNFDNCELLNEVQKTFICTYSTISDSIAGTFTYQLKSYDDNKNLDDQRSMVLIIDSEPPSVSSFTLSKNFAKANDPITALYSVKDTACSVSGCSGKCTGIKDVRLLASGVVVANKSVNSDFCDAVKGELKWSASGSGVVELCLTASDMFFNEGSPKCANITVDATAPAISEFKLNIGASPATFVKAPVQATASAVFSDDFSFDANSARANFSALNPGLGMRSGTCTNQSASYICSWAFEVNINNDALGEVIITAVDSAGNIASANFPVDVKLDKTSPKIVSAKSDVEQNGTNYIGVAMPATIKVVFDESGSGFSLNKTFLNLNPLNSSYPASGAKTNGCLLENAWTCYWYNASASGESRTATINLVETYDDVGNSLAGSRGIQIRIDADKPEILNNSYSCTREKGNLSHCRSEDTIILNYYLIDELPIKAYANFSEFVSSLQNESAKCETVDEAVLCGWTIPSAEPSSKINRSMKLFFEDSAGNIREENPSIIIYQVSNETNPDFWKTDSKKITVSPSVVDRQTASLISQRVYFGIPMETNYDDIEILSMEFGNCTNIPNSTVDSTAYLNKKPELFNNIGKDPRNPYILLTLNREQFKVDSLDFACSFSIISRAGKKVTQPESELFNVSIKFYNLPLGEISKSVQDEIERAKNDPVVQNKLVGSLQNIINFAEKICNIMYSIQTALNTFAKLGEAFKLFKLLKTPGVDLTAQYTKFLSATYQGNTKFIDKFTKYCAYISCDKKILWGNAYDKFLEDSKKNLEFAKKLHFNCVQGTTEFQRRAGLIISADNCGATIWPQSRS